jgi:hypothetical protein
MKAELTPAERSAFDLVFFELIFADELDAIAATTSRDVLESIADYASTAGMASEQKTHFLSACRKLMAAREGG